MKKTIKNIWIFLFGMLLFVACFDDDGNYDYLVDENPISFGYTYQGRPNYPGWGDYTIYPGDTVIFDPVILNDSVCDVSKYRWEYYVNGYGLVCTTRVMKCIFPELKTAGSVDGIVRAINTENDLCYTARIIIKVLNEWDKGWLILTDHNNTSKLNLVKQKDTVLLNDFDLTQIINQEVLGSGAQKLIFNTNSRTEVRVLQNSGNVILGNVIYQQLGSFENEFAAASYPASFEPKDFTSAGNVAAIQGKDGRVFIRTFNNATVYAAEKWVDVRPLTWQQRTLNVQYLLGTPYNTSAIKNPVLYDAELSRFFILVGNGFNEKTGSVHPIITDQDWDVPTPDSLSDYDVEYCQLVGNSSNTTNKVFAILKKKADNSYYYYNFEVATNNLAMLYAKKITCEPVPASVAALMGGNSRFLVPPTTTSATKNHLFIVSASQPTKLYVTNMAMLDNAQLEEYKSFEANITAMNFEPEGSLNELDFGVGLENGEFYILNASLSVLDDLANQTDAEKVVFKTKMDGKVVDLFYKHK